MINLDDFLKIINYNVVDGYEFQWNCYGGNAQAISHSRMVSKDNEVTVSCVFDRNTQQVFEIQAWERKSFREYRWIHPGYIESAFAEAKRRRVDFYQSIDDNQFIDIEELDDMLEKARAIYLGIEYDSRLLVRVDLSEEDKYQLMCMAHEEDLTLNEFVNQILTDYIKDKK